MSADAMSDPLLACFYEYRSEEPANLGLDDPVEAEDYLLYLDSPRWWHMRRYLLAWAFWACQGCGREDLGFHVHHIDYQCLGRERPCDLVALCYRCHTWADRDAEGMRILQRRAARNPGTWHELRTWLAFEPREHAAQVKLAALHWGSDDPPRRPRPPHVERPCPLPLASSRLGVGRGLCARGPLPLDDHHALGYPGGGRGLQGVD